MTFPERLDAPGILVAEKWLALSWKHLGISPLRAVYYPRYIFSLSLLSAGAITSTFGDPLFYALAAAFVGLGLLAASKTARQLRAVTNEWNAELYKAYAPITKEYRTLQLDVRLMYLCAIVMQVVIFASTSGIQSRISFFLGLMLFSMLAHDWCRAAEPPAPDDGDTFALPQPT